jgi:MFS family permease
MYAPAFYQTAGYRYYLFALCFLGGVSGGITATLMSAYLPVSVKELVSSTTTADLDQIGAVINAAYLFGMMFGGILTGIFSDRFGRKPAVILSMAGIGLFTFLTAFAPSWSVVVACRVLSGFGVGGILVSSATLIAEVWSAQNRRVIMGILSITIPVGIFSAGLITYNITAWRTGFLFGLLPLVLAVIGYFTIKESEKWSENRKLTAESPSEPISMFAASYRRDILVGSVIYGSMLIGLWAVFLWLPTWIQTLVQGTDGQQERGLSMILFAIGGLSGGFASGWVSKHFGVKRTMLVCFGATFVLTFLMFKLHTDLNPLLFVEIGCIALFFGLSQGVLNAYIPALFPTAIRSAATGFCFNIGRIFTASVVFFIGWLETALGGYGNALFTFSFVFFIGFIAVFFAREKDMIQ